MLEDCQKLIAHDDFFDFNAVTIGYCYIYCVGPEVRATLACQIKRQESSARVGDPNTGACLQAMGRSIHVINH